MTRRPTPDLRTRLRAIADDARDRQWGLAATHLSGLAAAGVPDLDLAIGVAAAGEAFSDPNGPTSRVAAWHIMARIYNPPPLHHEPLAPGGEVVLAACAQAGVLGDVLARLDLSLSQDNGCVVVRSGDRILAALPLAEWREAVVDGAPWAANAGPRLPVGSSESAAPERKEAPKVDWSAVRAAMARLYAAAYDDDKMFPPASPEWLKVVKADNYLRDKMGQDLEVARSYAGWLSEEATGACQPLAEALCRSLGMEVGS